MTFIVRYPGAECPECDQEIRPGELAQYVPDSDGDIRHAPSEGCPVERTEDSDREVCPRCWTTKSVAGACMCNEDDL